MKSINHLNYFMVGCPLLLALTGWLFQETLIYIGLLFTILTGGFQVIVGIGMFIDTDFKHIPIRIYLAVTALFFLLWIFTYWQWIVVMPPLLALYMSVILIIETKKELS
jgi:CHASE2 domain-containing sensor protein